MHHRYYVEAVNRRKKFRLPLKPSIFKPGDLVTWKSADEALPGEVVFIKNPDGDVMVEFPAAGSADSSSKINFTFHPSVLVKTVVEQKEEQHEKRSSTSSSNLELNSHLKAGVDAAAALVMDGASPKFDSGDWVTWKKGGSDKEVCTVPLNYLRS